MDILEYVKRRADLQSLMLGAGTVFAGTAATVIRGNMEILPASVCLLFAIFLQLCCSLYHYSSYLSRSINIADARISSSKLKEHETVTRLLREGSTACLIISVMLGLTLLSMTVTIWWCLLIGVLIYGFTLPMVKFPNIYRHPISLLITFFVFGPIGVMGTAYVQYQYEAPQSLLNFFDSAPSIFLGPAMGFLACSHHIVLSYFNNSISADPKRKGIITALGRRGAEALIGLNGVFSIVCVILMVILLGFPDPLMAIVPCFLGFCINTYIALRLHNAGVGELKSLTRLSRVNFLLTGFVSLVIWWMIGAPDDSLRVLF